MKLVFNKPNSAITRYDFIEEKVHIGKILEIGSNQIALMKSTLRKKIINSDYLNLDINPTFNNRICTIKEDIVSYKIREKYDTIIMLEVLEHLHLREWSIVISKLKKSLKKGGILIVSTPYKQSISNYVKIIESIGDRDLICTNDIHGTFYSPSQRKPFFRTAGFAINKDALIDDSVKPFLNCAPIAFFFLEKGNLKK